ncbi:hypothetical protein [Companilactobacillus mishanensis]|uniref:Uncharacterized protein n=2 Tax=Companilactobacillus mishanensis TaxID=2486008 RepID=A0A5P0ZHE6_9LACO|nr:hypothetical protein [Companilactobacillus mishanensis]MQS44867.1 hypothetical protein [Companilactobacillus mishanensis]MQS52454.1 hypothetical protein [Companilactobacillus mishanensis]MQS89382.1 hypothetical protein [Companilactobacillus mishanensis]
MMMLKVNNERSLNQAITAKVNNLQVTDQAFDFCKEARTYADSLTQAEVKNTQLTNRQKTFNSLYKKMRSALRTKTAKQKENLQTQITSQYMIRESNNGNAYELIRDTLV